VRYILWDFDGTLAERPGMWSQCLADVANEFIGAALYQRESFVPHLSSGFPWHRPDIGHPELVDPLAWWSALAPTLSEAMSKGANLPRSQTSELVWRVRTEYVNPRRWRIFTDTTDALKQLSANGWRHVILSNHVPELPTLVHALGIGSHFEQIHTSAIIGYEKPNPMCFQAALEHLPPGAEVTMVGDNYPADILGAQAVGLKAVLVRKPHPTTEAVQSLVNLAAVLGEA